MTKRIVFTDGDLNELECHLNENGTLCFDISKYMEGAHGSGCINLDKEDVSLLIEHLTQIRDTMSD